MLIERGPGGWTVAPPMKRMSFLMNTWVYGEAVHEDPEQARLALDAAFLEIRRLEGIYSRFLESSVVSRINREAALRPVPVEAEVAGLLERCLGISQKTDGAFDITAAPLSDLWRSAEKRGFAPASDEIAEALQRTGHRYLRLDRTDSTVAFLRRGMALDLGGVGKGYILDRAAEMLKSAGITGGLLNAGGNILSWGREGISVDVRDPLDEDRALSTLFLKNEAVATSANDERFFRMDGRRYGHILDPRTGWPAGGDMVSASVVASDGMTADACSTAVFVMGEARGAAAAGELGARIITAHRRPTEVPHATREFGLEYSASDEKLLSNHQPLPGNFCRHADGLRTAGRVGRV